jgi:MATE family multidrug resistance protein
MLTADRVQTIARLALPNTIALGSTMIMGLIDLVMVAGFGNAAIAAVGMAGFCYTLVVSLVFGIEPAVQGIVARRRGERSDEPASVPVNAGLLLAFILGVPLTALCYVATPFMLELVTSESEVVAVGTPYLQLLFLAIVPVAIDQALAGYWNGVERPKVQMTIIVLMSVLNVVFNYAFIFGELGAPRMGVAGAAVGTVVSYWVGVSINAVLVYLHFRGRKFWQLARARSQVLHIFKLGLPSTMQQFFFSAGYLLFFAMIAELGTAELAAGNMLVRITMVLVLLAMSLGVASATLVSKAVGEGDPEGAAAWGWDCAKLGVMWITALGLPMLVWPEAFLALFLQDVHTTTIATWPLRMVAATTGLGSLIYIFAYTLYSVGDGNRVVLISFSTQWFIFLPAVWLVGPYLKYGLTQIWLVQMVYGMLATVLITAVWMQGRWKTIKI